MTRNAGLSSVNCTACGAGLDVLGGGRVVVQVCAYCGAELDAQEGYKVLRQFDRRERPLTPLSIGMQGNLYGAEFVVIGIVERTENWAGRSYSWINHQLYSPTHGYAWLTLENGHFVFSRRYRGSAWISELQVETFDTRPSVLERSEGKKYQYYETTTHEVTYAEGEFTWRPKVGEKTVTISALSDDAMLEFSQVGKEREAYRCVYVPGQEVEAAFGLKLVIRPYRVHPLEPFATGRNYHFLLVASAVFCGVCLALAMFFSGGSGKTVLRNDRVSFGDLPAEISIPLEADGKLAKITLSGDVHNSWAFLDLELSDPAGEPVFQAGRTIEAYSGRDSDGRWSEGSRTSSLYFRPEQSGEYRLALEVPEQGVWNGHGADRVPEQPVSQITVSAKSGLSSGLWMLLLAAAFGALSAVQIGRKVLHHRARWSGSDWVDED